MPVPVLPSDLDGCHVLAVPAGGDVRALAAAWFGQAMWEVFPLAPEPPGLSPPSGARFPRAYEQSAPRPGRLRLAAPATLVGPYPLPAGQARAAGLPERDVDLYGLPLNTAGPLVLGWMTAAARRAGGVVVSADRQQVIAPDPAAAVDLTLWTGAVIPAFDLLPAVRPLLAGARMGQVAAPVGAPEGAYSVTAQFEFDGALTVSAQPRDAVAVAVAMVTWGEHGPWTYQVSWVPPDPAELTEEQPSRLHLIARSRVAPVVARVVRAVQQRVGGVVVDDGGFPLGDDELARRAATL